MLAPRIQHTASLQRSCSTLAQVDAKEARHRALGLNELSCCRGLVEKLNSTNHCNEDNKGQLLAANRHREQNNRCTLINRVKRYSVRVGDIRFLNSTLHFEYRANLPAPPPPAHSFQRAFKRLPTFKAVPDLVLQPGQNGLLQEVSSVYHSE
eukprot:scaffold27503_cov108-Skeletonema_marinoi.AAC.1